MAQSQDDIERSNLRHGGIFYDSEESDPENYDHKGSLVNSSPEEEEDDEDRDSPFPPVELG